MKYRVYYQPHFNILEVLKSRKIAKKATVYLVSKKDAKHNVEMSLGVLPIICLGEL